MDEDEDAVGASLWRVDPLAWHAARFHRFNLRTLGQRHVTSPDLRGLA